MVNLDTIVYHVCEKTTGDFIVHIPDVSAVYNKIVELNEEKYSNILLLPEYTGNENWAEELAWLTANFTDIPVMLDVFGGGFGENPTPQLSTSDISDAMAVCDLKYIRIMEVISWHIENEEDFPTAYLNQLLTFAQTNNLKVFWSEWKLGDNVFNQIKTYITGFEDIVTVAFQTNSEDLEPQPGFEYVKELGFTHWGASIQTWYWHTRNKDEEPPELSNPDNMPISWLIRHAIEAKNVGAEIIQIEPYWFFFGLMDGKSNENLEFLHFYLNSEMSGMETTTNILQTIYAEWLAIDKTKIHWVNSRVDVGIGLQPSTFDFAKIPKDYAVCVYSLGSSSPSRRLWLKNEVIAVDVLVKVLGSSIEKAALIRDQMRTEIERIIYKYSAVAPLWKDYLGPTGAPHRRRVPGIPDVVISQQPTQIEDKNFVQITVYVNCKISPNKTWI